MFYMNKIRKKLLEENNFWSKSEVV
jgi:hypothetical protein